MRVLPVRGVKFKITNPDLKSYGLTEVTCRRGSNQQAVIAALRYKGKDLKFRHRPVMPMIQAVSKKSEKSRAVDLESPLSVNGAPGSKILLVEIDR